METFFFCGDRQELFGAYWPPAGDGARTARAVLIANPLGQEYMRTHRALNQLAALLARGGYHVLRFDYFGCGDSAGDGAEVTLARCRADLRAARRELAEISGNAPLVLLGVRLGANLVLESAAAGRGALVLWDPIPDGRALLARLRRMERAMHRDLLRFARPRRPAHDQPERLLGHPYSDELLDEIARLDLGQAEPPPGAGPIYLLAAAGIQARPQVHAFIERAGDRVRRIETDDAFWGDLSTIEVALLPVDTFQTLARELGSVNAAPDR